ncbi:MAG: putative toxin-antitoxin system toxin component, PIN family [bacterium]|nr:putative toxin-antitoxin system toxin component, PIN family [bacterium]
MRKSLPCRVVLDTNVLLSAILFGGYPRTILESAKKRDLHLVTSKALLLEAANVLSKKFAWSSSDIQDVVQGVDVFAEVIATHSKLRVIKNDPSDNMVLECALDGRAEVIISGDKRHVLPLKRFRNIPILSPATFVRKYL